MADKEDAVITIVDKDLELTGHGGCKIKIGSRVRHYAGGLESTVQSIDVTAKGEATLECVSIGGSLRLPVHHAVLAGGEVEGKHWTDRYKS